MQEKQSNQNKKKYLWLLLPLLLAAALMISYFTWWPLPVEAAYDFDLKTTSSVLTIEEDSYGEEILLFEMLPKSSLLATRAKKATNATPLQWTSSDPGVVQVDEWGKVQAVDKGEAVITGTWGGLSQSCQVTVYYPQTGIALSETALRLNKKETADLSYAPLPSQAELTERVSFVSEDPYVAEVDAAGHIVARHVGTTRIVAQNGSFEAACEVTVLSPMTGMHLNVESFTLAVDHTLPLRSSFSPKDTTDDKTILWESSNPQVASVDETGLVTAIKPGETEIIARTGAFSAIARITVLAPLKGISFKEEELRLIKEESALLKVYAEPANTTDPVKPVFSSDKPEIVSVNEKGRVTALAPGEALITARTGHFTASCRVIVRVPMEGIAMQEEGGHLVRGTEKQLSVAFFPEDTNDDRTLHWESSDESVLRVNQDGLVQAVAAGQAEIKVRCGEFTASLPFTVIVPVTGVAISQESLTLTRNSGADLKAWVLPEDTTEDRGVYFTSSNEGIARVDGTGHVTGVGPGECVITARHGEYSAACQVNVTAPLTGISLDQNAITLLEGKGAKLSVSYQPWDTTDSRAVSWSSSDSGVAGVDEQGNIWANGAGDCRITATVGAFSASAQIHVDPYIPVQSVHLNATDISFYYYGESFKLTAQVEPSNATNPWVSWSSSDPSVVSVGEDGSLSAKGSGTARITATAEGKSASCVVYVTRPPPTKVVVIDAGHGGIFDGAIYDGRYERHMNLTTAYACKNYLEANYKGVAVYMTRTGDSATSENLKADLYNRAAYANQMGADILVSLHYNASLNHNASGVAVYASFDPRVGDDSQALASGRVNQLAAHTGLPNGGVHLRYYDEIGKDSAQGDYYGIIRHSATFGIPAVLVEHCHMDYDIWCVDEEEDLIQFGIQDAIAIARYLGLEHK